MELFFTLKNKLLYLLRRPSELFRVIYLRLRGINVAWSAKISWSAELSKMNGAIVIGENTIIDRGVILRAYHGQITIGDDCSINPYCVLYGHGGLKIGNGVRIATHCVFIPANHIYEDPNIFIYKQGETEKGITIQDDVWFGAGARVLDGVTIEKGAVIGAGAVVTRNLRGFAVYAGVPAIMIKERA